MNEHLPRVPIFTRPSFAQHRLSPRMIPRWGLFAPFVRTRSRERSATKVSSEETNHQVATLPPQSPTPKTTKSKGETPSTRTGCHSPSSGRTSNHEEVFGHSNGQRYKWCHIGRERSTRTTGNERVFFSYTPRMYAIVQVLMARLIALATSKCTTTPLVVQG